jgi:hypothetical protein
MKFLVLAFALGAAPAQAAAAENAAPLQLQAKAAVAADAPHRNAPFVIPASGPSLDLSAQAARPPERSRSSCAGSADLCYDTTAGHLVYKPARQFMPDIPGLRPENISVKRDRIVFRYSF